MQHSIFQSNVIIREESECGNMKTICCCEKCQTQKLKISDLPGFFSFPLEEKNEDNSYLLT